VERAELVYCTLCFLSVTGPRLFVTLPCNIASAGVFVAVLLAVAHWNGGVPDADDAASIILVLLGASAGCALGGSLESSRRAAFAIERVVLTRRGRIESLLEVSMYEGELVVPQYVCGLYFFSFCIPLPFILRRTCCLGKSTFNV
jgi:hypothetical protein